MTVLDHHKTGHTIWELVTVAVLSLLALAGAYILLVCAAHAGQPSRLVFDNPNHGKPIATNIVFSVRCWQTNAPYSWTHAHWEYLNPLDPTDKRYGIFSDHVLTMSDLPPVRQWPVIRSVHGTTNASMSIAITNQGPCAFYAVEAGFR